MSEVRLINADKLIRQLEICKANANPLDYNTKATYAECIAMLKAAEAIDAEPIRHGRWIKSKTEKLYFGYGMEGYYDYPKLCSVCHYDVTENGCGVGNYCPNCGAKMGGGKKE